MACPRNWKKEALCPCSTFPSTRTVPVRVGSATGVPHVEYARELEILPRDRASLAGKRSHGTVCAEAGEHEGSFHRPARLRVEFHLGLGARRRGMEDRAREEREKRGRGVEPQEAAPLTGARRQSGLPGIGRCSPPARAAMASRSAAREAWSGR